MFSTAAQMLTNELVELVDDRGMQPAENIVPVARIDALQRWGSDVEDALNAMSEQLTTLELRVLNQQVADGQPVEDAARRWLVAHDLLPRA